MNGPTDSTSPLSSEQTISDTLMIAFTVVVCDVFIYDQAQMFLAERHDAIETFLFDRANEPLGMRVCVRRADRRLNQAIRHRAIRPSGAKTGQQAIWDQAVRIQFAADT